MCGRQWVAAVSMCVSYNFFFPERLFLLCHRSTATILLNIIWRIKKDSACNHHKVSREISLVCPILAFYWYIKKEGWWGKAKVCLKLTPVSTGTTVGEVAKEKGARRELCGPCPKALQVTYRHTTTACRLNFFDFTFSMEYVRKRFWAISYTLFMFLQVFICILFNFCFSLNKKIRIYWTNYF